MAEDPTTDQTGELMPAAQEVRTGFCAILGLPNVGKSTLLNRVLGIRLVAVSRKPQTTRNRILGVHNTVVPVQGEPEGRTEPAQIIFVDTPGMQQGPGALRKYMRDQALGAVGDADLALLVMDASDPAQHDPRRLYQNDASPLMRALTNSKSPVILVVNKIDCLPSKQAILPVIDAFSDPIGGYGQRAGEGMSEREGLGEGLGLGPSPSPSPGEDGGQPEREGESRSEGGRSGGLKFAAIVPISAQTGDGIAELVALIGQHLPPGPRLFPEDMVTDRAERFLAAELIREQLFRQLGQELPYATAVVVESFRERSDHKDVVIDATIYVERDSQKGIVVGKGGRRIKEVGQHAREAISQLLGCPAHVKLYVKVANNWTRMERGIRQMGYE